MIGVRIRSKRESRGSYSYIAQTFPCQRRHLRTARRVWRIVVLATQTPLIRVLPTPQAAATGVFRLSDWGSVGEQIEHVHQQSP